MFILWYILGIHFNMDRSVIWITLYCLYRVFQLVVTQTIKFVMCQSWIHLSLHQEKWSKKWIRWISLKNSFQFPTWSPFKLLAITITYSKIRWKWFNKLWILDVLDDWYTLNFWLRPPLVSDYPFSTTSFPNYQVSQYIWNLYKRAQPLLELKIWILFYF